MIFINSQKNFAKIFRIFSSFIVWTSFDLKIADPLQYEVNLKFFVQISNHFIYCDFHAILNFYKKWRNFHGYPLIFAWLNNHLLNAVSLVKRTWLLFSLRNYKNAIMSKIAPDHIVFQLIIEANESNLFNLVIRLYRRILLWCFGNPFT